MLFLILWLSYDSLNIELVFLKCKLKEESEGFCISFLPVNKNEYILTTVQLCVTNYLVMMNIQKLLNTIVEMI